MDLDLRLVRYAVVLADELHYARAAARLHIAQQTLSAQINQLEGRLGVVLFARNRRHVELTAAGEVFVRRGRNLLADAQDLLMELNGSAPPLRMDVITEGLTASVAANELRRRLAGVVLEVVQGQGLAATLPAVVEGRVDLAVGWVDGIGTPLPSSLSHQLLRWEPVALIMPADHPLAAHERVAMEDLRGFPLVLHTAEEAVDWRAWNEEVVAAFGLRIGWRLHGHGRGSARAAVLTYQAPAFGPVEAPLPDGVVCRELVDPLPLIPMSVVWRSQGRMTDRLRGALSMLHGIATDHDWLRRPEVEHWVPNGHGAMPLP